MSEGERILDSLEGGHPPSKEVSEEKQKIKPQMKNLFHVLIRFAVIAGGITLLCLFVICPYAVHGNRMFPKLRDGDCAVVLKIGGFQKGDVVTYRKDGGRYFARIVGTPGDHICINSDGFRINDMIQTEEIYYQTVSDEEVDVIVGEKEVFLLNDYRSDQADSRRFGSVKYSDIDGKTIFLFRWRGL